MRTPTRFTRTTEYGFPLLVIQGRVSTPHIPEFETAIQELELETEDCALIDLTACDYITSRGFPLLLVCQKNMRETKKNLFLAVNEEVREFFQVLHLHTRLALHASVADCVAAARGVRGMVP